MVRSLSEQNCTPASEMARSSSEQNDTRNRVKWHKVCPRMNNVKGLRKRTKPTRNFNGIWNQEYRYIVQIIQSTFFKIIKWRQLKMVKQNSMYQVCMRTPCKSTFQLHGTFAALITQTTFKYSNRWRQFRLFQKIIWLFMIRSLIDKKLYFF